jgi:glutamate-ammonia-ligase adenylyltransferase
MTIRSPQDLLLSPHLSEEEVRAILKPYGFSDCRRADADLQALADDPPARTHLAGILESMLDQLGESADPDQALMFLERYAKSVTNKVGLITHLGASPATTHLLITVFASSPFLSQILIRNPEYLYWVSGPDILERVRSRRDLERSLVGSLRALQSKERRLDALRRFKRRELLAIGVRDLLRKASVEKTAVALSVLAEILIEQAFVACRSDLRRRFGVAGRGFAVLGMGKLGGGELNFSSDVDLIYVCGGEAGTTTGTRAGGKASRLPLESYFIRLAQDLTTALSEVTNEGYLFRVDLRLRPEGKVGRIVDSLARCRQYYHGSRGQAWERLALIKAWPVGGEKKLGRRFLAMAQPFVYRPSSSKAVFDDVRRIKGLIDDKMAKRGEAERNVKLGTGGIREIEFLVQALQVAFGRKIRAVRERNTTKALARLFRARLISVEEHGVLVEAYWFLRDVEQQTHTLPADPQELRVCALRMGYRDGDEAAAQELFVRDHARHTERVHEVFARVVAGIPAS